MAGFKIKYTPLTAYTPFFYLSLKYREY